MSKREQLYGCAPCGRVGGWEWAAQHFIGTGHRPEPLTASEERDALAELQITNKQGASCET